MVKALNSDERSFFVENIIGDLENISSSEVVLTLKEELAMKPYAGLFIVYLIERFSDLNE